MRAVGVAFVFPDGDAGFHFVDDESARVEGGAAMRGDGADPDGEFADDEVAHAMDSVGVDDVKARQGFVDDAVAFGFGEHGIRLVMQSVHVASVIMVADPAFEARIRPDAGIEQFRAQRVGVERNIG